MSKNYLTEAFKEMELLEESKSFGFNKQGAEDLGKFLEDDTLDDFEVIIDPEATNKDELQDSYIGKVILGCDVCHSMIYKDPTDIIVDEESHMGNVGELCPYCITGDGYKVVGKVAPYEDITVEAPEDVEVKVDGKTIDSVEAEEDDNLDEAIEKDQKYPVAIDKAPAATINESIAEKRKQKLKENTIKEELSNMEKIKRAFPEINFDAPVTEGASDNKFTWKEVDGEIIIFDSGKEKEKFADKEAAEDAGYDLDSMEEVVDKALTDDQKYPIKSPISESMEDISITTEDTVIKVKATPRADK